MDDYSGYKIKRPHALAPLASVHEAVAADGRPGRFALKLFHPPASTNVRRFYAIEGWLLAAERQQQAAKKDGTVVEVLAFGRCEEGAFAVMPWQERLLEPMIKTLGPKGDTLRALAECLLNTIEKWETQTGGPHGNLKPTNIFFNRTGPLVGMTAQLSDPSFLPGGQTEALRLGDLAAVGTMLAQIVRRRPPGAWPIEEAPEWKALGNGGKGWLAFCNYLLNPSPKEGEVTLAEARKHLRKVPKDANPVKTAALTLAALLVLGLVGVVAFARFGNPIYMPDQVYRLAQTMHNPQIKREVPQAWTDLCVAWDTWLIDLQSNGPRLLRTEGLWEQDDQLRTQLAEFVNLSKDMLPATLVPEAASEKRLGVLANSPPEAVLNELQVPSVAERVQIAGTRLNRLSTYLENWARWNQLRTLKNLLDEKTFTRVATALQTRIPPQPRSAGYKLDRARTIGFLRELSLDETGTLLVASRWSEITKLSADMAASGVSGDRIQKDMPKLILERLEDKSSVGDFADSLGNPLEEFRLRRKQFLDPQVVRERFLKESTLLAETADVTVADFRRWKDELDLFSTVPVANDPRLAAELDASVTRLPTVAVDLELDAPAAEPGGLATLSKPDFDREFAGLTTGLKSLRDRPIVVRDLPAIVEETKKMGEAFGLMGRRLVATIDLLKPEIWLAKVAQAYGKFNETRQRWAAWQGTIANVTAPMLKADRPRFRGLRAEERRMKEWVDGLEGPAGFAALVPPELATATADTAADLKRLEAVRRDQAVVATANAAEWRSALPVTPWATASASVRAPLEAHREWLAALPKFATDLDHLSELLLAGFGWTEGVSEVADLLDPRAGVNDLTGRPAEWYAEAKQLKQLVDASERGGLTAAAKSGGLSRKLMAWRRLGSLAGWPTGAEDFDLDGGVITVMREMVGRDIKDEARRTSLLDEMVKETPRRFNLAARTAARAEAQLSAMFERMQPAGLTEADLDKPVGYNLALWRLKHDDWNETNLDRLRIRRDLFVSTVRGTGIATEQPEVNGLLDTLTGIELKADPNRVATNSPRMFGWQEEMSNEGLTLTATWSNAGRKASLVYNIVQPADGSPAFYLASRAVAVGEFVDLINTRSKAAEAVVNALPLWVTKAGSLDKPWNKPLSWRPRTAGWGLEVNPSWIYLRDAQVQSIFDNVELRARAPALAQAVTENPTARTPLQQVPPEAARIFAEQMLGARLPKRAEWLAVTKGQVKAANGIFRGPSFQKLWKFFEDYREGGQVVRWRPNEGVFRPKNFKDDGQIATEQDQGKLWFASVDDGPSTDDRFINLFGNVWVYLYDVNQADPTKSAYYVAGGSALSPPGVDITEPLKVEAAGLIGATKVTEGFTDVGIRPAFDAPPGFKERYKLLVLVRDQKYLTL